MMLLYTKRQEELHKTLDKLDPHKDIKEIKKINDELKNIGRKRDEGLKDCPFCH